jgi:hypothetical protein
VKEAYLGLPKEALAVVEGEATTPE